MTKRNKIIYWIATVWLALGMTSSGILQITQFEDEMVIMRHLGYPDYFSPILGIWKILGVIAILAPRFPLIKEWAYAGFFIAMSGAIASHFAMADAFTDFFGPVLLITLTFVSWYFRPADRRL